MNRAISDIVCSTPIEITFLLKNLKDVQPNHNLNRIIKVDLFGKTKEIYSVISIESPELVMDILLNRNFVKYFVNDKNPKLSCLRNICRNNENFNCFHIASVSNYLEISSDDYHPIFKCDNGKFVGLRKHPHLSIKQMEDFRREYNMNGFIYSGIPFIPNECLDTCSVEKCICGARCNFCNWEWDINDTNLIRDDNDIKLYGNNDVIIVPNYRRLCSNGQCKNYLLWDGIRQNCFRYSIEIAIFSEILLVTIYKSVKFGTHFGGEAFFNLDHNFKLYSGKNFLSKSTFILAIWSYLELLDIDYTVEMACDICGSLSKCSLLVIDGITVSPKKSLKYMYALNKSRPICKNHSDIQEGVNFFDKLFIPNEYLRDLLVKLSRSNGAHNSVTIREFEHLVGNLIWVQPLIENNLHVEENISYLICGDNDPLRLILNDLSKKCSLLPGVIKHPICIYELKNWLSNKVDHELISIHFPSLSRLILSRKDLKNLFSNKIAFNDPMRLLIENIVRKGVEIINVIDSHDHQSCDVSDIDCEEEVYWGSYLPGCDSVKSFHNYKKITRKLEIDLKKKISFKQKYPGIITFNCIHGIIYFPYL